MPAAALAAITAFKVIFLRKYTVALLIVIKVFVFLDVLLAHGLNVNCQIFYLCEMVIVWQLLLKNTKISAITLFPLIILRRPALRQDAVLINHERIHLRQQLELLVVFFYIIYVVEYYYWYFKLKNPYEAYKAISFEREAYAMEKDLDYLKTRKWWSFLKFRRK